MEFTAKKQLVEAITDEVRVLHPLLEHTLRHLEGVSAVNYTHGTSERGADFVVTRLDQSLGTPGYVGVVVKVGKILNNFDDIERQVDECRLPRIIPGNTSPVRLSEVWVINNSTISRNAQDKIQDKYSSQKISFINGEKLTELVDLHASYFWYNVPSDVGSYLQSLASKLSDQDSELNVLQGLECPDFYIDPEVQEFARPTYIRRGRPTRPRLVNLVDEVLKHRVSVLEGDMGYGKSKTARHIARFYCAPERFKHRGVLPIFTTFRAALDSKATLVSLVDQAIKGHLSAGAIASSTILVIVDGIDEAIGRSPDWREFLQGLVREANAADRFRVLFTSRPLRVLDEQVNLFAGARRFQLRPLSVNKVISFVEQACSAISLPKRLFEDLQRSDLFKQLPQSPIAAALLSRLISQNTNDLPSNLTELYSKSIENLLGRWDIAKGGCTEKEYKDAERVTLYLADYLVGNRLDSISLTEGKQHIADWHRQRNTNVPLQQLEDRVLNKSGIFLCDEELGMMAFRHRSFGEFLYAQSRDFQNRPITPSESFRPEFIYIQFFYTGLRGDCEDHLRGLLAHIPKNENEEWLKILLMPDFLLAGYQTPYGLTENNLYKLFIGAADLYLKIRAGETKTKLAELPEMHLLWFFQRIIRSAFEYEFFRRAIPETILRLDQELTESHVKHYALFFAACFAAELDDPSGLEFLIKTYGSEKLPLPISIALKIEGDSNKDFSKLPRIKEHEKKLNTLLLPAQDKSRVDELLRRRALDDLFERPVRSLPRLSE